MKRFMAIALVVAGTISVGGSEVLAAGSFASGGGSGGHGGGGSRSSGSSFSRGGSMSGSRSASRSSGAARASASNFRNASTATRSADPFHFFSPNSVVPLSRGGFVPASFNGFCFNNGFNNQFCWNGRRCFFPWRGSRFFGNGLYYAGEWWPTDDYDNKKDKEHREDQLNPAPYEPVMVPVPVAAAPAAPATEASQSANMPPISREFAYGSIVTDVQNRLAREGFFHGSVDGYLTAGTRTAIAMFQDRHQLVITGRIDAALLQALALKP